MLYQMCGNIDRNQLFGPLLKKNAFQVSCPFTRGTVLDAPAEALSAQMYGICSEKFNKFHKCNMFEQ